MSLFRSCTLLFIMGISVLWIIPSHAQTPTSTSNTGISEEQLKLEQIIAENQKRLEDTRNQRNTLAGQLQYLDTQAYVTQLKIEESESKIERVKKEAELLATRIDTLNIKLDQQLKSFLTAARTRYKQRSATILEYFLGAETVTDLVRTLKYHEVSEQRAQNLLIETEETKQNYEDQKKNREKKQEELTKLQAELQRQKGDLENQQQTKRILIAATRNQEGEYQARIAEARAQIEALKRFRLSTGANTVKANGLGAGEGGWYYSQRDERWAGMLMGNSTETVLDVGCFISSLAMILTSKGYPTTPPWFASNPKFFLPFSAWAYVPATHNGTGTWPGGLNFRAIANSEIDEQLAKGNPVVTSVQGQSHYIVLKKKVNGEYIMNDPIYGPDLKLSSYYTLSGRAGVFE